MLCWNLGSLEVIESLFKKALLDSVPTLRSSGCFCHGIDDTFEYCGVHVLFLGDISCRPRGQGASSYLSQEAELRPVQSQHSLYLLISENGVGFSEDLHSFFS